MPAALSDRDEILEQLSAYCWALDTRDFDALRDVFTSDVSARLGGSAQHGVDEIVDRVSSALVRFTSTQHLIGSVQVAVEGDRATSRAHLHAQHVWPEGHEPRHHMVGGRYEDRWIRTEHGWRISHRDLIKMWTEDR